MWRHCRPLALLAVALLYSGTAAHAQQAAPVCPVSGQPAKPDIFAPHGGGKVFFATEEAKQTFTAGAAQFATAANYQLAVTGQAVQVACPVLGKQLGSARQFQVRGVAVCCPGCQQKLAAASQQQFFEACFGANFAKIFTVQAAQQ